MHSRRVGDLKMVFSEFAYFGLTNSGITPPVLSRLSQYSGILKTRVFVLPGKCEYPSSFLISPSLFHFALSSESS
jgi:hypothetical protein